MGEVGLGNRSVLVVRVDTRAFPERELQLLDGGTHLVAGAHRASGPVSGHQHDSRAGHLGDFGTHTAQPLGRELGSVGTDKAKDAQTPFVVQHS